CYFDTETGVLLRIVSVLNRPRELPQEVVFSGHSDVPAAADLRTLKIAGLGEKPDVLAYLRRRTPEPVAAEKIAALVAKLGHDDFRVREGATKELATVGPRALPLLERASKSDDLEVARRAEYVVEQINARGANPTVVAAIRTAARSGSPDAAAVL